MRTRTFVADGLGPVRAYSALRRAAPSSPSFLFESVVGGERWGRYSILGYRPRYEVVLTDAGWTVLGDGPQSIAPPALAGVDPLTSASSLFRVTDAKGGHGLPVQLFRAHFGYFSWDIVHKLERVPGFDIADRAPLARFLGGSTIVLFDNLSQTMTIVGETDEDVEQTYESLTHTEDPRPLSVPDRSRVPSDLVVSRSDEEFMADVERAKEYIRAGDAFQIVLSRTFSAPLRGADPFDVYRAMRVQNPSPYMYYLDFPGPSGGLQIAGASPETMVRLEDGRMTVRPIAGTRPRGATPSEDDELVRSLLADEKERAEHVMLIDLGRNDVGRVSKTGTVEVVKNMHVERYSHVMHIVSEVTGRVRDGVSPLEVFRAAFPAGTLSGAPKIRAMQIIAELEGRPRGIYGGAVGYVSRTGDLDFAISIRTAVCQGGRVEVTAGAGIVEASDPRSEAEETRNKARAVLSAVEAAHRIVTGSEAIRTSI